MIKAALRTVLVGESVEGVPFYFLVGQSHLVDNELVNWQKFERDFKCTARLTEEIKEEAFPKYSASDWIGAHLLRNRLFNIDFFSYAWPILLQTKL